MDTILQQLREATNVQHRALEEKLNILAVKDLDTYGALLEKFHSFYAPLEARMAALPEWTEVDYGFERWKKTSWLETDLGNLGKDLPAPHGDLPEVNSFAGALGCLYVMEGATLGGQVISRHFRKVLELGPDAGLRFYEGYGEKTGERWQEFRALLARMESWPVEAKNELVRAAAATFEKLGACLTAGDAARA